MASASRMPLSPVHALAFPELTITARSRSHAHDSRVTTTGAATAALRVKNAAETQGSSEASSPTSRRLLRLIPAATPEARKPRGKVTLSSACAADAGRTAKRVTGST
jgi:hypothetical protein